MEIQVAKGDMGGCKTSLGFLVLSLSLFFSGTSSDAHSLSCNFTIDPRPRHGQPWCEVQDEVGQKVFLSCDCDRAKIKDMSPLGEEVKSMNTWETQTDTLRDTGDLLKEQMPDVTPEKHIDETSPTTGSSIGQSSATAIKHITWILPVVLTSFIITGFLGRVLCRNRRRCSQEA